MNSCTMIIKRLLPFRRSLSKPVSLTFGLRVFHHVSGEFVAREPENMKLVTKVVPIVVGEPEEAYVMVPVAIGQAIRAACVRGKPEGALRLFAN
jgi:hypothetical protein